MPPLVIFTLAVKPPFHVLGLVYVTEHVPTVPVLTATLGEAADVLPAASSATTVRL